MEELSQIKKDWDDLAELDPAWFNVPSDRIVSHTWNIEEFFNTGKSHIAVELSLINQAGIRLTKGVALDFGCGIGRITQALAEQFETCYGVDISPEMIKWAEKYNRYGDRVIYRDNQCDNLNIFDNYYFDFVYSNNVLQHVPPHIMKNYLLEFIRIIKNDGVIMFQVPLKRLEEDNTARYLKSLPKFHPRRIWNKLQGILIGYGDIDRYYKCIKLGIPKRWLYKKFGFHPNINMFCLEEKEIYDLFASQKCSVAHIEKYVYKDMLNAKVIVTKSTRMD